MRELDWSKTAVGLPETWPQSLRTAVGIILNSDFPMFVWWGEKDLVNIYNDAYIPVLGKKHPDGLGKSGKTVWAEVWKDIGPLVENVFATGKPVFMKNLPLMMHKGEHIESTFFTFSYSPIRDETGDIIGMYCACIETTKDMQAEAALKLERMRLYDLFMQAPVAITILRGPNHIIELANAGVCEFWGKEYDQVINQPLFSALPEAAGQGFEELLQDVLTTGNPFKANGVVADLPRDGKPKKVYFNFVYQPIFELDGTISGVLTIANEITDQIVSLQETKKLADQMLQQARVFDTALTSITDFIYTLNTSGKFTYSNKPLLDLLGIELKDIIGKDFLDLPYPKKLALKLQKQIASVIKTGKPVTDETLFVSPAGYSGYFEYTFKPVFDKTGTVEMIAGSTHDITERKQAIETLRLQLRVTAAITDTATACLIMIDDLGMITYMNPAAIRATKYTSKEAMGKSMHQLVHHSHPDGSPYEESECPSTDTYKYGKSSLPREDIYFRKDGSNFNVIVTGTSIPGKESHLACVIEFRDITDEKTAQRKRRELISVTEQRNALIKLNKTKNEFIALASHQLRTPATAVKQYIALLMDEYAGPITSEQNRYLQTAYDSNERQLKIVNDLLKTAQLDSNKYKLDINQHDIVEILQESILNLQSSFDLKNQTIVFGNPGAKMQATIDAAEIGLVLTNLLENASKYSYPDSKIIVTIQSEKDFIRVSIADSGVGISLENQQRIFDKFTRVDNDLSDTVSGTGLGLYWVKQIVELHQGSIELISEFGAGSKFIVRLKK